MRRISVNTFFLTGLFNLDITILSFVSLSDIGRVARVYKRAWTLLNSDSYWRLRVLGEDPTLKCCGSWRKTFDKLLIPCNFESSEFKSGCLSIPRVNDFWFTTFFSVHWPFIRRIIRALNNDTFPIDKLIIKSGDECLRMRALKTIIGDISSKTQASCFSTYSAEEFRREIRTSDSLEYLKPYVLPCFYRLRERGFEPFSRIKGERFLSKILGELYHVLDDLIYQITFVLTENRLTLYDFYNKCGVSRRPGREEIGSIKTLFVKRMILKIGKKPMRYVDDIIEAFMEDEFFPSWPKRWPIRDWYNLYQCNARGNFV